MNKIVTIARRQLPFGGMFILFLAGILSGARGEEQEKMPDLNTGCYQLRILAPDLLELEFVETWESDSEELSPPVLYLSSNDPAPPPAESITVISNGDDQTPVSVGFKRRVLYAPLNRRELRVGSSLYLKLEDTIPDSAMVEVWNPGGEIWDPRLSFTANSKPLRFSPVIHVNHEGYLPDQPKKAMVGYYLGSLGEMILPPDAGFQLVKSSDKSVVYRGELRRRPDQGYAYLPRPYQEVWEADFSDYSKTGSYQLLIPGLGLSHPFRIDVGMGMNFVRAYALGLYHQRCGAANELPFTRFTHDACHTDPASIPLPPTSYVKTWEMIAQGSSGAADRSRDIAPALQDASLQRNPILSEGQIDVSGGHHDAGDYSKYTINSASFIHTLLFAVDSMSGVAAFDNLGLPESGDGISDILQMAKHELDFLAKMQDTDGGFYFLVYPQERRYESDLLPDSGDPQVVWPKNTAATGAASAALAQAASSPLFRSVYPEAAKRYLAQAVLGWQFIQDSIALHGRDGAYQRITHYGDLFIHDDELAWAATELYLATGEDVYHRQLMEWFDPSNPDTRSWGWWRLRASYGNAIRSYAFASKSGRHPESDLNAMFLEKCIAEIEAAGEDVEKRSDMSAYGTSFPVETKRVRSGGWYFSLDQAFDLAVACQLDYPERRDSRPGMTRAFVANINYELGVNPVNISYITGLGRVYPIDIAHQYAQNDRRTLPPSGLPVGNIQAGLPMHEQYETRFSSISYPGDGIKVGPYPYYDRWTDTHNVTTEFTIINQARALSGLAWYAAQSDAKNSDWRSGEASIGGIPEGRIRAGTPMVLHFEAPEAFDISKATIRWEALGHPPVSGREFPFKAIDAGLQWVEAEAYWPDGRRLFALIEFTVE